MDCLVCRRRSFDCSVLFCGDGTGLYKGKDEKRQEGGGGGVNKVEGKARLGESGGFIR